MKHSVRLALAAVIVTLAAGCLKRPEVQTPAFAEGDAGGTGSAWIEATTLALRAEGADLISSVPADIGAYCPAYARAAPAERKAFWADVLAWMAREETGARGWLGHAPKAADLADGCLSAGGADPATAALACSLRAASREIVADGAIFQSSSGGWRGLAKSWFGFRKDAVRETLASQTRNQSYCGG